MKLTPDQKAAAIHQALAIRKASGQSWAAIAKQLGVSTTWLSLRVKGLDSAPLAGAITPSMIAAAKEHRATGATWRVVARRVGTSNAKRLSGLCSGAIKSTTRDYARMTGVQDLVSDTELDIAISAFRFGNMDARHEVSQWLLQRQAEYALSNSAAHVLRDLRLIGRNSRDLTRKGRVYLWLAFR